MFGVLYSYSKEMERIVYHTHEKSNRQIQLTVDHWHKQITLKNKKIKLLENQMIELEEHHKQEIGECVEFYAQALEEAKGN